MTATTVKKVTVASRGPKKPAAVTRNFPKERETKGTVVFMEDVPEGEEKIIGALYVQKSYLGGYDVESITLTVKPN